MGRKMLKNSLQNIKINTVGCSISDVAVFSTGGAANDISGIGAVAWIGLVGATLLVLLEFSNGVW